MNCLAPFSQKALLTIIMLYNMHLLWYVIILLTFPQPETVGVFCSAKLSLPSKKQSSKISLPFCDGMVGVEGEFQSLLCYQWRNYQSHWQGRSSFFFLFAILVIMSFSLPWLFIYLLQFFEMPKHEAMTSLEIYKRAGQQVLFVGLFFSL